MSSLEKLNEGQLISLPNRTKIGKKQKNKSRSRYNEVNVTELANMAIDTANDNKKETKKSTFDQERNPLDTKFLEERPHLQYQGFTMSLFDL